MVTALYHVVVLEHVMDTLDHENALDLLDAQFLQVHVDALDLVDVL